MPVCLIGRDRFTYILTSLILACNGIDCKFFEDVLCSCTLGSWWQATLLRLSFFLAWPYFVSMQDDKGTVYQTLTKYGEKNLNYNLWSIGCVCILQTNNREKKAFTLFLGPPSLLFTNDLNQTFQCIEQISAHSAHLSGVQMRDLNLIAYMARQWHTWRGNWWN